MKIYIIIEDTDSGVDIKSIRQDMKEGQANTPANRIAIQLEQKLDSLKNRAKAQASALRGAPCLH